MTATLRHEIDAAILENDIDALADLLCEHESDDEVLSVIYDAIDRVCANLYKPVGIDALLFI